MCLKFVEIHEFYEIFKIRTNSFYKVFEFAQKIAATVENNFCAILFITLRQPLNGNSGQLMTAMLNWGRQ